MYTKGKQYPSSQWDGNQLKCEGEVTRIDNIDISHGIEYEEDEKKQLLSPTGTK